uniref:type I-F CRISPR-associated protein Csy2 n=1 Tax=uncultured Acinetobacter sp. TaxID=165433 RepID=UPI002623D964|nr:type I-F CRISPR-associated protein Csy2 [uncultured Acinetobacter sp.]
MQDQQHQNELTQSVGYLLFRQVQITGANSISSPITYGFPAITGFLGAFHAMSRKLQVHEAFKGFSLGGVLLACHDCQPQVYRSSKYSNYTFNQTRNPIKKDGKTASIIEEGKCHLTMSFVVEVLGTAHLSDEQSHLLVNQTTQWIQQQRIAGGSVHGLSKYKPVEFFQSHQLDDVIPSLMPAFVLMDAQDEFSQIIETFQDKHPDATALDALLDVCTIHHIPEATENGDVKWSATSAKTGYGWLVPMPIGYQGISECFDAGVMQNVRNPEYPSQYVEAIYGLGKWLYPYHLKANDQISTAFWRYEHDAEKSLYLVRQSDPFEFV